AERSALIGCNHSFFFSVPHEMTYVVGCFVQGLTEVQFEFDGEEFLYADFPKKEIVYTVPNFIFPDPSHVLVGLSILEDALDNRKWCLLITKIAEMEEKYVPEEKDPPEIVLFSSDKVELGVENSLICFVNHFYPPSINVTWTKNGHPATGVSLSRYFPNKDQTFHQFSTLTFTPSEGDFYSCTVEHSALETPKTRIWEAEVMNSDQSLGPAIFCGVGLSLGLLGVTVGVFFFVKGHQRQ
uniref:H-2 class II histocompatibility antigen, A-U alpha chain n=2 Tax=Maylandia zebra TaxID=106582 RepID=A0A3P9B2V2_9CICH